MPNLDSRARRTAIAATPFGHPMRRHFLLEEGVVHLNHGSYGATPIYVLEAAEDWRRKVERQPSRFMNDELPGKDGLLRRMAGTSAAPGGNSGLLRQALGRLGDFLGARTGTLAFTDNTTAGVNAVLRSLSFAPGDEILTTSLAYGAVLRTIEHVCAATGARPVIVPLAIPSAGPDEVVDAVAGGFSNRTRLLVVDHVAAHAGLVMPIDALVMRAAQHGVRVLVDGAHAVGMLPVAVERTGADWYVGSGHKWLMGPKGIGFLWAAPGADKDLHPPVISHGYGKGLAAEFDWPGTRDFANWLALSAALDVLDAIGLDRLRAYNDRLTGEAVRLCTDAWGTQPAGPPQMLGAMAAVRLPGDEAPTLENAVAVHDRLLDEAGIEVAIRPMGGALWVRFSMQIYNEPDDYRRLAEAFG